MKASLLLPVQTFETINFWILFTIMLGFLFRLIYVRWSEHINKRKESVWIAIIFLLVLGIDLENPASLAIFIPPLVSSFLEIFRKNQNSEKTNVDPLESVKSYELLIQENLLLKKRILDSPKTFFSQAAFFSNLITLNEIQLIQSVVESANNFLSANQVSLYQFKKSSNQFFLTSRYHRSGGLQLGSNSNIDDRIFYLISDAKKTITIRDICRNDKLYQLWQNSFSKALVYSPIYYESDLIGVLTIDDMDWHHFHRDTVRNMEVISKLTGQAFRNIQAHQTLLTKGNSSNSGEFSEFHNFLKTLNTEFKRANRNQLPLSVLLISLDANPHEHKGEISETSLRQRIKENCLKNLREVDLLFEGKVAGQFWAVLPFTNFNGLCYVMERINLITKMDLSDQPQFDCHFGFSSIYPGLQKPHEMILACQETLQLHKTVTELVHIRKTRAETING